MLNPRSNVTCANLNRRPIQNCTSVYQMQLYIVISDLITGRRQFALIKGSSSSDSIEHLVWNKCGVHLSDQNTDNEYELQFIWAALYWSIICCKDICNNYSSGCFSFFPFGMAVMVVWWYCTTIYGALQQYFDNRDIINIYK